MYPVTAYLPVFLWECSKAPPELLTPPVGPALFYLQGVAPPGIELAHLYRGVVPFVLLQLVGLAILFIWPELATWLPKAAY